MKSFFISMLLTLSIFFPMKSHALEFKPSLDLGIGLQHYESDGNSKDYLYAGIKSYMFQQPGSVLGFKLVGLGLGINTNGDAQVILSPLSVTVLSILTVAPDYGIGINNAPNYWGLSIGIGF